MLYKIFFTILATISPLVELNGGIPLGVFLGLNPILTFFIAVIFNLIIFFPIIFLMNLFYNSLFLKIRVFQKYLERVRKRSKPYVDKYGYFGLALFITLPTPLTGVYTGTLAAWIFSMDWKRAFLAITVGVIINGIIILSIVLGILKGLEFLL